MSEQSRAGWVSVVIPTYNRATRLVASVDSCLTQTHDAVEVIVVDDGSTDETPEVLAQLEARWGGERFRWVRQDNQGASAARNHGMSLATGEYLQLHDSDDLLLPDKFTQQIAALERTGADVAVSDILVVKDDAEHTPLEEICYDHDHRLKAGTFQHASIPTLLMRRSTFPAPLRWNTRLPRLQDVDFVVRYLLSIERSVHTPGFHVLYIYHDDPQIRDSYAKGPLYRLMFEEFSAYWDAASHLIPRANHSLYRQAALTLAWRAALRGDGADARAILPFAMRGPGAAARMPRACTAGLISTVPGPILDVARQLKRRILPRRAR